MQHQILIEPLGPDGAMMAAAVEKCVHCGFCLPVCPTYLTLEEEMDSPRGRIVLMKSVLENQLELEQALPYVDRCLGCLACVTACPSGVPYQDLITPFRAYAEERRRRPLMQKFTRRVALETLPESKRFRLAAEAGQFTRSLGGMLPEELQAMLRLLPSRLPAPHPLPALYPALGERRARVALLVGCVQAVIAPEINLATLRVLAINGIEVVIPAAQGCCGGLALHMGEIERARRQAGHNLEVFPQDVDAVLTNAAGCGSAMKEYPHLFRGEEGWDHAASFAARVQDVSEFMAELGLRPAPGWEHLTRLAYHDACHLVHAQGISGAPRQLLGAIPNLELVNLVESDLCCGSAGTYNFEQPRIAARLGQRKAEHIRASGALAVAAGNIGCLVQIRLHLEQQGTEVLVLHTLEVLDRAYMGRPLDEKG